MRQGPFLLCLCRRGAFTVFQMIFLFRCSFEPEAESRVWPLVHKWNKPSPTAGKPGRMILSARPDTSGQTDKTILPCRWFARFHATGYVLFGGRLPFFTDFSFEVFCLICLYFRLPPFSRLSVAPHQAVISVLGAKVTPGFFPKTGGLTLLSRQIPELPLRPERKWLPDATHWKARKWR